MAPPSSPQQEEAKEATEEPKVEDNNEDTAQDYENQFDFYSEGEEVLSEVDEEEAPKLKERNFEFSSSINMMRVIRLIICVQVIGLMIDSPSVQLPAVFRIVSRLVLFYSTKFYSRPIIDFVYLWQWVEQRIPSNWQNIKVETPTLPTLPTLPTVPTLPGGIGGIRRVLQEVVTHVSRGLASSASDYIPQPPTERKIEATFKFLDPRIWHSTKHFSHYFLSALFVSVFFLFTLKFWEIKDYTDRREIREWLRWNIADGWWRRGLLVFTWAMVKALLFLGILALLLFAIARELNHNSTPTGYMVGGALSIFVCAVVAIYIIGYIGMRAVESVFVRYVSQNVSYTSSIILQRVIKAKIDIGIVLMFIVYMPALRVFAEGFFIMTDWNDNLSFSFRRTVNFYTPCYLMAFPPYHDPHIDPAWCPVDSSIYKQAQPVRKEGYYMDRQILSCDSYLGVTFFTLSMLLFAFTLIGYAWLYWEFVDTCVREMRSSRWVTTLHTLISIRKELYTEYAQTFNITQRLTLDLSDEIWSQVMYIIKACRWIVRSTISVTVGAIKAALVPIYAVLSPFIFVGSRCFLLFCCSKPKKEKSQAQLARERRKMEEDFLKSVGSTMSYSESISILKELSQANSIVTQEEEDVPTFKERCLTCLDRLNIVKHTYKVIRKGFKSLSKNRSLLSMKLAWKEFLIKITRKKHGEVTLNELGGTAGGWRLARSIISKAKKIKTLDRRIKDELRVARQDFVSDHALSITVFDRVIDTSGLFMLISQYHYDRLYWTMVLWLEMTIYSLVSAYSNFYLPWQQRLQLVMVINAFFGVLTYVCKPFTEDTDRWLDFLGRILVGGILYGIVYCSDVTPSGANDKVPAQLYKPWDSFAYLKTVDFISGASYVGVDCLMTLYFYGYIINVLEIVGFFAIAERTVRTTLYGMHDHVLDYLINMLERRAIGRENIFQGMLFVQQWDDIITEQRRYALLSWPDVRPADLVPLSVKMVEIKWAAFFNLTLKNIRSSLGLSLMHTSMCAADSEVSRWLIHLYPELLNAEDFQRDTPVLIALKECSYFLVKYGEQNEGELDDGTGYDDDRYLAAYPEIDQFRIEAADCGEYIANLGDVHNLDAFELRSINKDYTFTDTKDIQELRLYRPSFLDFKSKLSKYATQEEIDKEKEEKAAWEALTATTEVREKTPAELKEEAKQEAKQLALEKASLYRKRFPEDDFQDNYESGQLASWGIVGLSVPDVNLFIDPLFARFKDSEFTKIFAIEDKYAAQPAEEEDERLLKDADDDQASVGSKATTPEKVPREEMEAGPDDYYDEEKALDMRYNVKSLRFPEDPDKYTTVVPNGHPALQELLDWDIIRKKKRLHEITFLSVMHDAKRSLSETGRWLMGRITLAEKLEKEREVRFKMCKFAEILLSDEIQQKCSNIEWNLSNYKALNKMSNKQQGRIAQNLAMSCNINPPPGFTRISEWSNGISINVFDEHPNEDFHFLVNAAVKVTSAATQVHKHITSVIPKYVRGSRRPGDILMEHSNKRAGDHPDQEDGFSDRVIHYLAECFVACRRRLNFADCELSVQGRNGWRAIARALRRNNCTFIMPSMFVATRQILTTHLNLSRNELDDGDAVLLSDILLYKQSMKSLDLSHNRIGARGLIRMCKAMKGHQNIKVLNLGHNRIGPAAGRELGVLLKQCNSIEVLDLSYNRLGELIQYPTKICRQRVLSAARDIFQGLRKNRSIQILDLSYNHLGPVLSDVVPLSVMKHPFLTMLNLSGNDMGERAGASLIFALGHQPGGDKEIEIREKYYEELKAKQLLGIDVVAEEAARVAEEQKKEALEAAKATSKPKPKSKAEKKKKNEDEDEEHSNKIISKLAYLGVSDNQLGRMAGFGLAAMVTNSRTITSLDASGNSLGYGGGVAFADGLEKAFNLVPRDFFKKALYDLEQEKFTGRDAKVRTVVYTNLTNLNLAQNGLGPLGCQGIMYCMASSNCTITSLDLSRNPLGYTVENGGNAMYAGIDMRKAIASSYSMTHLNLSRTQFLPVDMVPLVGALNRNRVLKRLVITDTYLDEPSCLQLAHGMTSCPTLTVVDVHNTRMGPKGGLMVVTRLSELGRRLTYFDISDNGIGPIACIPIGKCLQDRACTLRTLYVQGNDLMDEGGAFVIRGMKENNSLTDVNLSNNCLTGEVAEILADVARGLYIDGKKISDCQLKRLVVSDNPEIGAAGAKLLARAMTSSNFTHVELANIGAGPGVGKIIGTSIRDVALNWVFCDISGNNLSRNGLNDIFWGLRQNRSLRVFNCGDNKAGSIFGSDDDALLGHGIALQRGINSNVMLRELDLSFNALSSNACANVFEAMVENYTIRKLCLRGNKMDDEAAEALSNMLQYNNVCEDLDLGNNNMGFDCCYVLGEGIKVNRAIKILTVDTNNLSAAGDAPLETFMRGICANTSMRVLIMDGNKFGSEWGYQLASALARNNTLIQVSFRDNRLDDRAGQALLKMYKAAPFLLELAVSADEIGTEMYDQFKRVYDKKRSTGDISTIENETYLNEKNPEILASYYHKPEMNIT